jgi:DNA-binding GntR family transcriptional regulator
MSKASPEVLRNLSKFDAERIDQTVERLRLALADRHYERAHRVIDDFERTVAESRPCEAVLDATSCERLRRRGIVSVDDLRQAADQLDQWVEITPTLRKRVRVVLERLA